MYTLYCRSYTFYPLKQGPECCSEYTISFHYVRAKQMYLLEHFLYKIHPYGLARSVENASLSQTYEESTLLKSKIIIIFVGHMRSDLFSFKVQTTRP